MPPKPPDVPVVDAATQNQALALQDCYKLALKQSELIAIDSEKIKEAEAHFLEAFGTILPQVSFGSAQAWRNSSATPSANRGFDNVFIFKQTLFSGFKELAGMSGSKLEKSQRAYEKLRAEQLLFSDVSDSFYLLIEIRQNLKTFQATENAFSDRIKELKARVDIGKSRTSEVVSTETQLYAIEDQIEQTKNQEKLAQELLSFLTGKDIDQVSDTDFDFALKPESEYILKLASRPDVLAADYARQVGEKEVIIAKSGFFPSVNLETDYYAHRSSVPNDSRVDTMLTVDVPIFEGTTTFGQVKEARAKAMESTLVFQRSKRLAAQEIHDAYVTMQSNIARKDVLGKALQSAELNYNLQLEDYKRNVVNNLDVLTAIQNLEDAHRSYNHITYASKRFYWQLLVSAGEINVDL